MKVEMLSENLYRIVTRNGRVFWALAMSWKIAKRIAAVRTGEKVAVCELWVSAVYQEKKD